MKKLYLSITLFIIMILMFAVTMIPTQAYTFNGSYDFSNIDLDASLTELNGASLNDLFDYNYINYEYLGELPNGVRNKFVLNNGVINFAKRVNFREYDEDETALLITNWNASGYDRVVLDKPLDYINYLGVKTNSDIIIPSLTLGTVHFGYNAGLSTGTMSFFFSTGYRLTAQEYYDEFIKDRVVYYEINTVYNNTITQVLDEYFLIPHIDIDLLNYYFAVYILNAFDLPVGDLWTYAYTAGNQQGYTDGYQDGEDFGYLDGYNDGLVEGYYDGEAQGLIDGYNVGYNEGVDYAVQENISILSIFELIFGVALNMLTFIITIDIFGISILSLISVLSLFVGVVWILKMIRG